MKIDRHNYEEFFLLYVDNELTEEQKKSVDQFVQQNPDLAIELEILQQTTLQADDAIVFHGKEMLLKKDTTPSINLDNYEEYLISYIDNELTDAERLEFFKFAESHPLVKEELSIYQQTKLQPEKEIVFENKHVLYRREEKVKVITIQWWKIAVAAAVILAAGITTIKVINSNKSNIEPAPLAKTKGIKTEKNNSVKPEQNIKKEQANPIVLPNNTDDVAITVDQEKKEKINSVQKTNEQKVQKKSTAQDVKENNESLAVNSRVKKNNNDAGTSNVNTVNTKAAEVVVKKTDDPVVTNDVAAKTTLPKENINSKPVTPTTDEALDNKETAQENTNENAVYASNYDEGKNKKLRGFFRKASRVFERRTNISASDEERQDKVLIGALAVKLK